jgi:hypothetical protein
MGRRAYKASRMKTDIVIAAIASWLTASNEPVIVQEWQPFSVKVL